MPLFSQWNDGTKNIAIWKIEEPETFFTQGLNFHPDIKSDKRRIELLAGRYLLSQMEWGFEPNEIIVDEFGKPRLPKDRKFFSLTHSYPYVAAIIKEHESCGIDLQVWHPRILQLQHKFLDEQEMQLCRMDEKLITAVWGGKEVIYKYFGKRMIEHNESLKIELLDEANNQMILFFNVEDKIYKHTLKYEYFDDFAIAYSK